MQTSVPQAEFVSSEHYRSFGVPRSIHWASTRHQHLELEPACVACGSQEKLQVHHILPFHIHPELELEQTNLITLCQPHHFTIGHRRNWQDWNPHVREDAEKERKHHP